MTNLIHLFLYSRTNDSSVNDALVDKSWFFYSNLISLLLLSLFIIFFGILLSNNAKHVKILNLFCAFYLSVYFFFSSLNYSISFDDPNFFFNQNTSSFVNLFIFIATITVIIFFLSISDVFYIAENSKIEFALLTLFIYIAAVYLISSTDFISIIILLECIAFSSYVLVGFERFNKFSTTSALKYLILASIPSGFFILGLALLYQNYGTFSQDYIKLLSFAEECVSYYRHTDAVEAYQSMFFQDLFAIRTDIGVKDDIKTLICSINNTIPHISIYAFYVDLCYVYSTSEDIEVLEPEEWFYLCESISTLSLQLHHVFDQLIFAKYLHTLAFHFDCINNFLPAHTEEFLINLQTFNCDKMLEWFSFMSYMEFLRFSEVWLPEVFVAYQYMFTFGFRDPQRFNLWVLKEALVYPPESLTTVLAIWSESKMTEYMEFWASFIEDSRMLCGKLWTKVFSNGFLIPENMKQLGEFIDNIQFTDYFLTARGFAACQYIEPEPTEAQLLLNKLAFENILNDIYYADPFLSIYLIIVFLLVNLCFKLTASPFHFWAPSVYGGAPLATLTFLSIFSKAVIIFFFAWLFMHVFEKFVYIWQPLCLLIACLSVIFSILGAFSEKVFKRFFVYSSTGHVGFLLIGIAVLNINGIKGTVDYLLVYIVSSFIIWFIIMHLTKKTVTLINLKGLALNNPFLGFIFSIVIFSLSGIPPMGGFFVKYEIFYSLLNSSFFYIAYLLLFLTIISFFYYLRLIKIIFFENQKTFYKNKALSDIKLRLISYAFFIIPFYMIFIENPFAILLKEILLTSL